MASISESVLGDFVLCGGSDTQSRRRRSTNHSDARSFDSCDDDIFFSASLEPQRRKTRDELLAAKATIERLNAQVTPP